MDLALTVHCPAEAAQLLETVVNFLNPNVLMCVCVFFFSLSLRVNLSLGPLHGKLSSDKSTLSQGSRISAIIV